MYHGNCVGTPSNPGATTHVTVGTAGIGYDSSTFLGYPWSLVRFWDVFGYAKLTVLSPQQLRFQFINAVNGTVMDDWVMTSNHTFAGAL